MQPNAGTRLVDDELYEVITQTFFQQHIALSSQDIDLFNLSVRENLTLGTDISDKELTSYLAELDMSEWLSELQDGLDTVVGEKGIKLSAGQKQRLSILRTILLDRDINILDEPTSHLDAHTGVIVTDFLERHLSNKSGIIITHRPALQRLASDAYVMQNHTLTLSRKS